jgi:signal transduction histidine kinase
MKSESTYTILVIDDEPVLLKGAVRILQAAGYTALAATTGEQGEQLARQHHPDLILLDVDLPDINGIQLCQQMKIDPTLSGTYVIMFSGSRTNSDAQAEGLEAGADGYILKPVANRELLARVQAMLRIKEAETKLSNTLQQLQRQHDALQKSQARFRKLIDCNADAIIVMNKAGVIRFVNRAAQTLFEVDSDELVGKTFGVPLVSERTSEVEIPRGDGRLVIAEMRIVEIDWDDEQVYLASLRDITDRKHMEQQWLQAKEAAEAANHAKSEFLANMSHELRTPLNGILGYAQIMQRDPTLTSNQQASVEIISRSGEHLLTLINDILDLSKIEAGKMELRPADFPLTRSLKNIVEMTRIRAQQKGLTFRYNTMSALPEVVHGDEKRLRQVLLNLLGNACKFTVAGGVTFKVGYHYDKIRFEVADTGIGIPRDKLHDIFQPFQQVNNTQIFSEGTGLGLSISQRLVRSMGGELQVKSTPGEGSVFWFDLRLPEVPVLATDQKTVPPAIVGFVGKPCTILAADDKPENLQVLRDMLTPLGLNVVEALDGAAALAKARDARPDLMLLDLFMPEPDGFELARRIRAIPALAQTPLIAVSASAFETTRQQSLDAGFTDFLSKPVRFQALLDALGAYLDLEWVYEQEKELPPATGDETTCALPPEDILHALLDTAKIGDVMEVQRQIAQLDQQDPALQPFIAKIQQFAQRFQMNEICSFLETAMNEAHNHCNTRKEQERVSQ